ncbi:hypothetical protein GOBAR_AA11456 [Gossypium barbadense]|uniref:Uncharacterized protein n=1 Tax=Gossypium barbadense TaxID=3634 RepID=A0A2P5Y0S4_GOSBA|nr:hypothetical protein GOBAR_AA11456 [Gossypium barbadense]
MGKERSGGEKQKRMVVGVVCNFAAELKLLLTALLLLCTLVTLLQFVPSRFTISASDLRFCISPIAASPSPSLSDTQSDDLLSSGILRRAFHPYGAAAYNFITMGTYRGGPNSFAIVGLASKPLHLYSRPAYQCQWLPSNSKQNNTNITSSLAYKILPDWGYGRVYTVTLAIWFKGHICFKGTFQSVLRLLNLGNKIQKGIESSIMLMVLFYLADLLEPDRRWGFEKLVYRDVKRGIRRDRKYAIQPRNVYATGVHMSQNLGAGAKTTHKTEGRIKYFHYHGTIAQRREPCRNLVNSTDINFESNPFVLDTTLRDLAGSVKKFELKMIGSRLYNTRQ